ncbi:hypothetical protein COT97_03695 [Candidatus Falkowbacteria bacterium CG10_big_fil_rev_8_21_14_0_10_39_11]|uniref:EamA domain-containing protein n=1 Tax=Candidatus Falkowbacteria bacterium CG10_big_fil_rev_8_21_14_0_10_39_11 TaxID=1974565 RepID=A0A2H0V4F4_9BACT|nr:MAG: hypothetical protein COT97_03695 [Candidatus Falkowbacteria bacterium CG10_big_fil_rev_8_21_14_0_10_39_11]
MEWVLFTLIAMLFWTAVNILDKYIVSHELRDPILTTTIFGVTLYLLFIIFAVLSGTITTSISVIILSLVAGICYTIALLGYYYSMQRLEVSRFVPILAVEPLVISILAFIFFAEKFSWVAYLGILFIVAGSILISHEKASQKKHSKKILLLAFLAMAVFAIRNLLIEAATLVETVPTVMFWFGVGGIIIPIGLIIFHHPHLREKAEKGVQHLIVTGILSAMAMIFFTKAISVGPITLVVAFISTKPLLVFIVATLLSFLHPKILRERISTSILLKKSLATAFIVAGGILVIM